jgi:O-antigen ligase
MPLRTHLRKPLARRDGKAAAEGNEALPSPGPDHVELPLFANAIAFLVGFLLVLAPTIDALAGVSRLNLLSLLLLFAMHVLLVPGAISQIFRVNPYMVCATLLLLCLAFGITETRAGSFAITKTVRFGLYWVVIASIFFSIGSRLSLSRSFFYGIACAGALHVVFLVFFYGSPTQLATITQDAGGRLGLEEQGPIGVARTLGLAVVGFIYIIQRKIASFTAIVASFFLLLTMPYLFFSGSRTVMFGLFLSMAAGAIFVLPFWKSNRIIFVTFFIFLFIIFFALNFGGEQFLMERFGTIFEHFEEADNRTLRWEYTLELIANFSLDHWLIGRGTADYAAVMAAFGSRGLDHPHNIFLELLYENGIIGVSIFIVLLLFVGKGLLALRQLSPEWRGLGFAAATGFFFALVNAQASFDISRNFWVGMFAALLLGMTRSAAEAKVRVRRRSVGLRA